ncbi:MAG: ribonuclease Y, partial [Phycisphaerae bacterium]|nr:ribonuclease Y [Phycisphaerae bacterium]
MHSLYLAAIEGATIGAAAAATIVGLGLGFFFRKWQETLKKAAAAAEFEAAKKTAEADAAKIIAKAEADARTEFISQRKTFDSDTESTRKELRAEEKRLAKREDLIDQKLETIHAKERMVDAAQKGIVEREKALATKDRQLNELIAQQKSQLLKVANLSIEDAKKILLDQVEREMSHETAQFIERQLEQANEEAEDRSREVVVTAIQRYASAHTCESTVSTVDIPSDDMKGRVIGREGRNIRAFEKATGVDVIVDDTPGVVVVSCFDPVRRYVARQAMAKLIQDGRIHPTRIEEVVAAIEKETQKQIHDYGKAACTETQTGNIHGKLVDLLGRLHFRTSYGQNVLQHSIEVAFLSQIIADELGLNGQIARRCGLLHDIGKAVDHEVQGGHPAIGADLCKRYGEKPEVINAAAGHHGDVEAASIYMPIVAAADAISASRPGARRESLERYVQRLEKLEAIATTFEGVEQAYAIQAGREVRVIVDPSGVDD